MLHSAVLLLLLCSITLVFFGDRGAISCNSVNGDESFGIQGDFGLSLSQDGWVYAALMVGITLSAPLAAQLSKRHNALRLIGIGCSVAATAATAAALAPNFPLLLLSRALMGVAAGPFITLASPLIDDCAPRHHKSLYLAALFLCIPTGFALGYIWASLVATAWGWRAVFMVEAALVAPLAAVCLLAPQPADVRRGAKPPAGAAAQLLLAPLAGCPPSQSALAAFFSDLRHLAALPVVILSMLAAAAFNGALGGFSFYGPKAARALFGLDPARADILFGLVTVATGVVGTLSGGLLLDALGPSVRTALLLCTLGLAVSSAAILSAFAASRTLFQFCAGFSLGEGAMFMTAAPINAVLLWSVPPGLRPAALSIAEVLNHLLGDVPLPPLLGYLQQCSGDWRATMSVAAGVLGVAAALFAAALWVVREAGGEESEVQVLPEGGAADDAARESGLVPPLLDA